MIGVQFCRFSDYAAVVFSHFPVVEVGDLEQRCAVKCRGKMGKCDFLPMHPKQVLFDEKPNENQ